MIRTTRYDNWKYGVTNAIPASELNKQAVLKSQNIYYKENRWVKTPGLVEKHPSQISSNPVWSIGKFRNPISTNKVLLVSCGDIVYKFNEDSKTFTSIRQPLNIGSQIEFLEYPPFIYFGSKYDNWRRYDGGDVTYSVGGIDGEAPDAPKLFSKIIFSLPSGRFFGIGEIGNEDLLQFSDHIDDSGIEKWPDGNIQIIDSVNGDSPKDIEIFEGMVLMINEHSIHSGNVVGVTQNWRFQKEKSKAGTIAMRTVKRYGSTLFMMTKDFEIYAWPNDKFITKGRVKFNIDPYNAHLACAEIVDNRYYYICFKSGEAVASNKYHLWIYDILGDAWYGPHKQYNMVSMYYDKDDNILLCGGIDNLEGYLLEHRGLDIKNTPSSVHWVNGFDFQDDNMFEKKYEKFRIKAKQTGSLPNGQGNLEVILNVSSSHNPVSQGITLEDPANENLSETGAVKDAIIKRGYINDSGSRGECCQVELKHSVQSGEFEFSEIEIDYYSRRPKYNRG